MRIAIGSDHRGFSMKAKIIELLQAKEFDVFDMGPADAASVDYPDYASLVSRQVSSGDVERGILICGTGIGMAIAANKFPGVRAAPCHDELTAEMSRRHNDLNVLCLSSDMLSDRQVTTLLEIWITTPFEGGRHARRVEKITQLEIQQAEG